MSRRQLVFIFCLGASLLALGSPKLRYLAVQASFQAEILLRRVPLKEAVANGDIPADKLPKLAIVDEARDFGASIHLKSTQNYETMAVGWNRKIWNVSASQPDRFAPQRWWFPITGSLPYLGYFREQDARAKEAQLKSQGLDVYVRTAGAYSTLGWFNDPLLPHMLDWSEYALSSTLLHELAHATLWIPGSIKFNESFANVVGEEAALQHLAKKYGADSEELATVRQKLADRRLYRSVLHELYENLDTLYNRSDLSREEVLNEKSAILNTLPQRVESAHFHQQERYSKAADPTRWNNARLMQFKTYNASSDWFRTVLKHCDSDLQCFISRIDTITADAPDPFAALETFVAELSPTKPTENPAL
jgi:predicted aminopeptidase